MHKGAVMAYIISRQSVFVLFPQPFTGVRQVLTSDISPLPPQYVTTKQ